MKRNLLYFLSVFFLMAGTTTLKAQNLLSEGFEGTIFPPPGWTNTTLTNLCCGNANWDTVDSYSPSFSPPNFLDYFPDNFAAHSGNKMAWYNSGDHESGDGALLATSAITLPSNTSGDLVQVSFWLYHYVYTFSNLPGNDAVDVYMNTTQNLNGTPLHLGTYTPNANTNGVSGWVQYVVTIPDTFTNSNQYLMFKATANGSFFGTFDNYLDDVSVDLIPPCNGPTNGTIQSFSVCPNQNFHLYYTDTLHGSLSYSWQSSPDSANWTTLSGNTAPTLNTSITVPTYFRVLVRCNTTGDLDTAAALISINPFYVCYCYDTVVVTGNSTATTTNIGNVSIKQVHTGQTILDNGVANPTINNPQTFQTYTNYNMLNPTPMVYMDSAYRFSVVQISQDTNWYPAPVGIYIDMNHDGIYETSELVLNKTTGTAAQPGVADTFVIPTTATIGVTGMRVIMAPSSLQPVNPCTPTPDGEVEDYFINIEYGPCDGYPGAGTAQISDTSMCPGVGYTFTLTDTTHDHKNTGLVWSWQASANNGVTWADLANTANKDTLQYAYNSPASYRLRIVCLNTHDTIYSNQVHIGTNPPYACYCASMANGGALMDSCDIGAFAIGPYIFDPQDGTNQPHLMDQMAVNGHSDFTGTIMALREDTTYNVMAYQVMRGYYHSNGKVTMFIDFNGDGMYDATERVFSEVTSANNFFLQGNITIPNNIILGQPTGMRVIINSNTGANVPSDDGCGVYTSGETEDYAVRFYDSATAGVNNIAGLQNLAIYPNPTTGIFNILFNTTTVVKDLNISVTNITGQQIMQRSYQNTSGSFSTQLDMGKVAPGIYFIQLQADGQRMVRKLTVE